MMARRTILAVTALGLAAAPFGAVAHAADKVRRIGFISLRSGPNEYDAAFREALRSLGYVEGQSIRIENRWAAESEKRAEALAAELVASGVELIVAATTTAIRAAVRATTSTPIVMAVAADPVGSGLVASLARPGGNVTGLTLISADTAMKRLQLLRELVPSARRVALLIVERGTPDDAALNAQLLDQSRAAAGQLGLELVVVPIRGPDDIENAFLSIRREEAQALIVQASSVTIDHRKRIIDLAASHALAAMYETEGFVAAGGLLSYGPSIAAMYRRAATYVDKILKGADPAGLPVEQPTEFRLVINRKAAEALGLPFPPSFLARADEVIE